MVAILHMPHKSRSHHLHTHAAATRGHLRCLRRDWDRLRLAFISAAMAS
eukprot:CAMPEP_0178415550 /NCGR_PEP_ID=MMETSP0689_2-20121128/23608_1 /TAXON_ID=160604 /ORGANISM="Amphidinium massartii, Strain CS-259" /LENGTH=48 /DNA_ID= /DNA_START= /DNA_END= /DNA_ORIENTATION=